MSDELRLALWGPTAAGKTAFLAQLHLETDGRTEDWRVFPTGKSLDFIEQMHHRSRQLNHFPKATSVGHHEQIVYHFHHREDGRKATLSVEDRAGEDFEKLEDEAVQERLRTAHGLVLLLDPERRAALLETDVGRALRWLHVASGETGTPDPRPVAVCWSKADVHLHDARALSQAIEEPDHFVRERLDPALLELLDRYLAHYRLFPVSAVGVHQAWGSVRPRVFYDESLELRLVSGGTPLHLMTPFAWLLDQIDFPGGET